MNRQKADAPVIPSPDLVSHAQDLLHHLKDDGARFVLWDKLTDAPIELSEEIFDIYRQVLIDLAQNRAVQIMPLGLELTTVQAAEFLQVSRPHLVKLIKEEKLKCRMVGTHRRIRLVELVAYRQSVEGDSRAAREQMTKDAEKYGWGY
jgi:excisionase family DNA binding protein